MWQKLQHHWITIVIVLFIGLGIFLRLYRLGNVPTGLGWDEAAIGYNGWSVWTTRRDEWLNRLPISFRSFGDYKAPLAIYLNGPFTLFFGMNAFAVRLPFALFASATLIVWWRLLELIRRQGRLTNWFVLFGVICMAFSPWHFVFSRIAFESVICLFFVVFGVWTAMLGLYSSKRQIIFFLLSGLSFVASLYTYHSAKIVVPLLLLSIVYLWRSKLNKIWKKIVIGLVASVIAVVPLAYDSVFGQGATRAGDLVFVKLDSISTIAKSIGLSTVAHLNPTFVLLGQGDELRHVIGSFGILIPGTLILIIIGLINFYRNRKVHEPLQPENISFYYLALLWTVIGMLPGIFSMVFPHANRTLLALPGVILLASFGFEYLTRPTSYRPSYRMLLVSSIITIDILWSIAFFNVYFTRYQQLSMDVFQAGYDLAVAKAFLAEKNIPPYQDIDTIVMTAKLGQPYIYLLFYGKISPLAYHNGRLVRYLFPDEITIGDLQRKRSLLIFSTKDPLFLEAEQLGIESKSSIKSSSPFVQYDTSQYTR